MARPRTTTLTPVPPAAEAAYERWLSRNPYRYGSAGRTAFLAGFMAAQTPAGASVPHSAAPAGDPWEAM